MRVYGFLEEVRFSHPLLSKSARKPCIYWFSSTFIFLSLQSVFEKGSRAAAATVG